ncbi:hypothetical protein HYV64_03820 [Candidatus Shapirobacteria bacterium]|nr:hypothetical protein [Candidatus Shapirobacteria bacterium]
MPTSVPDLPTGFQIPENSPSREAIAPKYAQISDQIVSIEANHQNPQPDLGGLIVIGNESKAGRIALDAAIFAAQQQKGKLNPGAPDAKKSASYADLRISMLQTAAFYVDVQEEYKKIL